MLRRNRVACCCVPHIPNGSRVGIFPLHLDPPTIQHCEIFRLLVNGKKQAAAAITAPFDSSLTPPLATCDPEKQKFGRLKENDTGSCACDIAARNSSLLHFEEFEKILQESSLAPFDHLILVPNTKFPVTLRQSVHLAAMAVLATRDLPRVHVELKALEHPDDMMPIVHELVTKFKNSTIIHWLPNVYEMQNWKHFDEIAKKVPLLLLRPRGWRSATEALLDEQAGGTQGTSSSAVGSSNTTSGGSQNDPSSSNNGASTSSPSYVHYVPPPQLVHPSIPLSLHCISDKSKQNLLMPRQWDTSSNPTDMEIVEVPRMSGSFVRQELWECSTDPCTLIPPSVLRYIDSHGLYRDFRKGSYSKVSHVNAYSGSSTTRSGKMHTSTSSHHALVAFDGLIPRLELHYDHNNLLAREQYNKLKAFECLDGKDPDLIVPIGGDGYFMHCVRKNWRRFIPFFGVNAGHVGYLLNDCATLEELFSAPLKLHHLSMLYCEAETENATGEKHILAELAFNDAWVERASGQTALIRILVNGEERIRRVRGDGVLVSTAAGSTAYSQALGASPVPVGAPLIQLVGSNIVSPPQWKPVHLNQEDCVEFECADNVKRPCRGFVDSLDVGIVSRMLIRTSRVAGVQVAFADSCDLQQKLYKLQFPKSY